MKKKTFKKLKKGDGVWLRTWEELLEVKGKETEGFNLQPRIRFNDDLISYSSGKDVVEMVGGRLATVIGPDDGDGFVCLRLQVGEQPLTHAVHRQELRDRVMTNE